MPIDIASEPPIPLTQATIYLPRRRRGRKAATSTLHRWATRGLRGVVLETIRIGGTRCTSLQALQRFFDRLSDVHNVDTHAAPAAGSAQHRTDRVDQELDQLLGPSAR